MGNGHNLFSKKCLILIGCSPKNVTRIGVCCTNSFLGGDAWESRPTRSSGCQASVARSSAWNPCSSCIWPPRTFLTHCGSEISTRPTVATTVPSSKDHGDGGSRDRITETHETVLQVHRNGILRRGRAGGAIYRQIFRSRPCGFPDRVIRGARKVSGDVSGLSRKTSPNPAHWDGQGKKCAA